MGKIGSMGKPDMLVQQLDPATASPGDLSLYDKTDEYCGGGGGRCWLVDLSSLFPAHAEM